VKDRHICKSFLSYTSSCWDDMYT